MKNTPQQIFQDCSSEFIGLNYKEFDCWEIVKLFQKRVMDNIITLEREYVNKLLEVDSIEWAKETSEMVNKNKSNFKKVRNPEFGDIALLNIFGLPAHLGIYLNEKQIMHTSKTTGCFIDRLQRWESRLEGYYRWQ